MSKLIGNPLNPTTLTLQADQEKAAADLAQRFRSLYAHELYAHEHGSEPSRQAPCYRCHFKQANSQSIRFLRFPIFARTCSSQFVTSTGKSFLTFLLLMPAISLKVQAEVQRKMNLPTYHFFAYSAAADIRLRLFPRTR